MNSIEKKLGKMERVMLAVLHPTDTVLATLRNGTQKEMTVLDLVLCEVNNDVSEFIPITPIKNNVLFGVAKQLAGGDSDSSEETP